MITDYASLQQAIADELNRDDLTSAIPQFIQSMERQTERQLRTREMTTVLPMTITDSMPLLPSDFLETRIFYLNTQPKVVLDYLTVDGLMDYTKRLPATGKPQAYTIVGSNIMLSHEPDANYSATFIYYQKIPVLSNTVTTNWLITNHPDVYFYGALLNSAPFLKDDARLQVWLTFYQNSVDALNIADERAVTASNGLKTRTKGFA